MLKIALTGGIGSGKSTVAFIFMLYGVPVYLADERAKKLMTGNNDLKARIVSLLGKKAYHEDGSLDNIYIAERVFRDNGLLAKLNSIVHPAVQTDFEKWAGDQKSNYVIEESAIIYEAGIASRFDKVILVIADDEKRIERVMKRDKVSREQVLNRMVHQMDQKEKINLADYIIDNNGKISLIEQIREIHSKLNRINNSI